jgi:hypothetical protein
VDRLDERGLVPSVRVVVEEAITQAFQLAAEAGFWAKREGRRDQLLDRFVLLTQALARRLSLAGTTARMNCSTSGMVVSGGLKSSATSCRCEAVRRTKYSRS